ncbi:MAG: cation diffusion facilitator family transporter [Tannerellaceae bacterium]|jgi:cobalt-zinc-cadmium efflux system protein|nr:cation diffusion facilitator family transporter [Tannerellaceae bacterium]
MSSNNNHHNHSHNHAHHHHDAEGNIRFAFVLNLLFGIIEIVGGTLTNSVAIISDAIHDLGDSFSLGLAWYFQKISKRGRDARYSYGYRRFSLVGALINAAVLFAGSLFVIVESIRRLAQPEEADAQGMFWLAALGVIVNGAAMLRMRRGASLNEKTVSLHLLEDVLGWVAVLIGSAVMMLTHFPTLDPLLSLGISAYVLFNIYRNLKQLLNVILQGSPANPSLNEVEAAITKAEGALGIHDLHIWSMDGEYNILSVHIVVKPGLGAAQISQLKQKVKQSLRELNINHATLEIEHGAENCDYKDACDP